VANDLESDDAHTTLKQKGGITNKNGNNKSNFVWQNYKHKKIFLMPKKKLIF
jgi:hypothetical protein